MVRVMRVCARRCMVTCSVCVLCVEWHKVAFQVYKVHGMRAVCQHGVMPDVVLIRMGESSKVSLFLCGH